MDNLPKGGECPGASPSKTISREEFFRREGIVHAFLSTDWDGYEAFYSAAESAETLAGIPCAVKDNIAVAGQPLTCGSRMLETFVSPYDATAVARLRAAGAYPLGKSNMDEFGMGSSTENSALGESFNPWDASRVCGGSSGGSAAAVAAGMVPFALGSDTGGSVRQPASFCGVYGLKPTYGAVSRYGLVAYASSLEVIGVLSRDIGLMRRVFETISGIDENDQTTREALSRTEPAAGAAEKPEPGVIGVLEGDLGLDPAVRRVYEKTVAGMEELGYQIRPVNLDLLNYAIPAYYTIATAEASANLARYTGIRYGLRAEGRDFEEMVRHTREAGFGDEVKLRILLGTYVLRSGFQDQYYLKAQEIRRALKRRMGELFGQVDMILMPVFPVPAFPRGGGALTPHQQKLADRFTATANLAGLPALAFPAGMTGYGPEDGSEVDLPVGMQLLAPEFGEERLFRAAEAYAGLWSAPPSPVEAGKEAS